MRDEMFRAGSVFDWISPLFAFFQDWYYGPAVRFTVPMSAGWGTDTISRILQMNGIRVWGVMLSGDMILFATRRKQARFAIYLLQREGIPFASNAPDRLTPGGRGRTPQRSRRAQKRGRGQVYSKLGRAAARSMR